MNVILRIVSIKMMNIVTVGIRRMVQFLLGILMTALNWYSDSIPKPDRLSGQKGHSITRLVKVR